MVLSQFDKEVIRSYYRLSIIVSSIIAFSIVSTFYTVLAFRIEYALGLICLSLSIGFSQTKRGKYTHLPWLLGVAGGSGCFLAGPPGWVIGGGIILGTSVYEIFGKRKNYRDLLRNLIDADRYRVLMMILTLTRYGYDTKLQDFQKFCTDRSLLAKFSVRNETRAPLLRKELLAKSHNLKISWKSESPRVYVDGEEQNIEDTNIGEELQIIEASIIRYNREFRRVRAVGHLHRVILDEMVLLNEAIQNPEKVLQDREKLEKLNRIFETIMTIVKPLSNSV